MIDVRRTLTEALMASPEVTSILIDGQNSVLQEDTLLEDTRVPCIVLAFVKAEPYYDHYLFAVETWDLWLVTNSADYYTLGELAKVVRKRLNRSSLDAPAPEGYATIQIEWVWDGPAMADSSIGIHTQVQRYKVLRQN